jgi:hypothetical protein
MNTGAVTGRIALSAAIRVIASTEAKMLDKNAEAALQERIRAEYREMPGMRLTLPQAARLFNLEPTTARACWRP